MTSPHFLVVPDDPDQPMEIEHPPSCPQHSQLTSVRSPVDNGYLCPFERAQWAAGLETFFGRDDDHVALFVAAGQEVRPGRHLIECGAGGLRLAGDVEDGAA